MAVVAGFSLVMIYYWALAVGLPAAEIEEMIEEVVIPEEEGLAAPQGTSRLGHALATPPHST